MAYIKAPLHNLLEGNEDNQKKKKRRIGHNNYTRSKSKQGPPKYTTLIYHSLVAFHESKHIPN
jgi:hypothetical protein